MKFIVLCFADLWYLLYASVTKAQENKVYIGMAGRMFTGWLKEHIGDIKFNRQTTVIDA